MAATSAWADDYTDANGVRYNLSGTTATVAKQRDYIGETLTIPALVSKDGRTYNVIGIEADAFEGCSFTSIDFSNATNLTYLTNWDFGKCKKVEKIVLPDNIEYIGSSDQGQNYGGICFGYMDALTTITLSKNLKGVGDETFYGDPALTTMIFTGDTPPDVFSNTSFGGTTVLNNITIVVPDNALDAYTTKFQNYGFKQIITQTTYEKTPCSITWNFVDKNGKTTATETKDNCYSGTKYTPSCSVVYGLDLGENATVTATGNDTTVNVTYTLDDRQWPFELSTSYDSATWYQVMIRDSSKYCQYDGSTITNSSTEPSSLTRKDLFAFVGTPFGFRIYNAKSGADKPFGPSTCSNGTLLTSGSKIMLPSCFF